jgi:hypothetical protein
MPQEQDVRSKEGHAGSRVAGRDSERVSRDDQASWLVHESARFLSALTMGPFDEEYSAVSFVSHKGLLRTSGLNVRTALDTPRPTERSGDHLTAVIRRASAH